jgi:uncharacterized protein (DUF302 family)
MERVIYGTPSASPRHLRAERGGSFADVLARARRALEAEGFLVLHTIETTRILESAGLAIGPLVQLLFFLPASMREVLEADPGAVPEAPLKLVVMELTGGKVQLMVPDPVALFAHHPPLVTLATALRSRVLHVLNGI